MASQRTTFADLPGRKLEMIVVCQKCGHESVITGTEPKLQARPIAGQRFRCNVETNGVRCGGIGLPTMRTKPEWSPPPSPPIPRPLKVPPRAPGSGMTEPVATPRERPIKNWTKDQAER